MAGEKILTEQRATEILFGSVTLLLLMVVVGVPAWTGWVVVQLVGGLLSVFFMAPLFNAIVNRRMPREMILMVVVGGAALLIYKMLAGATWGEMGIMMLASFTVVSLFSAFLEILYHYGSEKIPP